MRESYEFRVDEQFAAQLFSPDEGEKRGFIRKVLIAGDDPRLARVGELQKSVQASDRAFFYGWNIRRSYTREELETAELFHCGAETQFEPAGEQCGTIYDESTACSTCGSGATQRGPLILDPARIPKKKDIAATIANEIVVSRRVVELFAGAQVTGAEFTPVRSGGRVMVESSDWFQLQVSSPTVEVCPPTRVGNNPFDDDPQGEGRCPGSDLLGLNLLSEVSIAAVSRGSGDIVWTRQFVGVRRGLLRPRRLLLISPKIWSLLAAEGLRGWRLEVAHVV